TVADFIVEQACRTPNASALQWAGGALSYRELVGAAAAYARQLHAHGAGRGESVGVLLPRSPELVVSLLGIVMAGAAYVPMSVDLPDTYLARVMEACHVRRLVARTAAAADGRDVLPVPSLRPGTTWDMQPVGDAKADDLAYVLCTSGSTGMPRAVAVEHGGLANVCRWIAETLQLGAADRCLLKTPVTFDASARELYPILVAGGMLVIASPDAHRDIA